MKELPLMSSAKAPTVVLDRSYGRLGGRTGIDAIRDRDRRSESESGLGRRNAMNMYLEKERRRESGM